MDITRENFVTEYPRLRELMESCDFIAFDEEMSGISLPGNESRNRKDDDPVDRYARMVNPASRYSIIQFGMCFFHIKSGENGEHYFEATPYNVFVFPNSGRDIILSASATDFLRRNNMDFGTWISKGVNFTDKSGEDYLHDKVIKPLSDDTPKQVNIPTLTRPNDVEFFERNMSNFAKAMEDENFETFKFEKCDWYITRVITQTLTAAHAECDVFQDAEGCVVIRKLSAEAMLELRREKREEAERKFQAGLGFRKVFKDLAELKKPIVGHNCLFDIMFMFRSFEGLLPNQFPEFKRSLNELIPYIFDTKYIASSGVLGYTIDDTTLSVVYDHFVKKSVSTIQCSDGFQGFVEGEAFHNAGYDAYCTGYVFASEIMTYLKHVKGDGNDNNVNVNAVTTPKEVLNHWLSTTANKLFMMQSVYHMDLDPNRPHGSVKYSGSLVHLSFPKEVKDTDVIRVLEDAGFDKLTLELIWVDGNSMFVNVKSTENVSEIIEKVKLPQDWTIQSHADFAAKKRTPVVSETAAESLTDHNPLVSVWNWLSCVFNSNDVANTDTKKRKRDV